MKRKTKKQSSAPQKVKTVEAKTENQKDYIRSIVENDVIFCSGPSGSGKSTLLNILSLIDRPNAGSIIIEKNHIDFKNLQKNDLLRAKKIGIIYQQDNLLSDFTAIENVYLASLAAGNDKNLSISKAKKLLRKVGLTNRSNHYPSQLSGGEKQRISIARALINDPSIIMGDEPTGNLDTKNADNVFNIFQELAHDQGLSLLVVTHDDDFAQRTDRIITMEDGLIIS